MLLQTETTKIVAEIIKDEIAQDSLPSMNLLDMFGGEE